MDIMEIIIEKKRVFTDLYHIMPNRLFVSPRVKRELQAYARDCNQFLIRKINDDPITLCFNGLDMTAIMDKPDDYMEVGIL